MEVILNVYIYQDHMPSWMTKIFLNSKKTFFMYFIFHCDFLKNFWLFPIYQTANTECRHCSAIFTCALSDWSLYLTSYVFLLFVFLFKSLFYWSVSPSAFLGMTALRFIVFGSFIPQTIFMMSSCLTLVLRQALSYSSTFWRHSFVSQCPVLLLGNPVWF